METMRVAVFSMPDGTEVAFAPHQRRALERAQRWTTQGYTLKGQVDGEPDLSDLELAIGLLDGYAGLTRIYRPPLQRRDPNRPYSVCAVQMAAEIPCVNFDVALDYAWGLGCNVVMVPAADMDPGFDMLAEQRAISLLIV
jgi:hypothetical protein